MTKKSLTRVVAVAAATLLLSQLAEAMTTQIPRLLQQPLPLLPLKRLST